MPEPETTGRKTPTGPPALVLGADITLLGAVRNLGRHGIPSFVLGPSDHSYATHSRWCRSVPGVDPRDAVHAEDLPRLLESLPLERAVLIPCADDWQLAAAGLPPALAERFPSAGPPVEAVRTLVDKKLLAIALCEHEIPHPRTIVLGGGERLDALEDGFFERSFLKPRDSQRFLREFDVKAFRCHSRAEVMNGLDRIRGVGLEAVLQEYVPGPATAHHFIDGFVDRTGRVRARFARRRERMYPPDFGNSTLTVSEPLSEVAPAVDALGRLLAALDYRGVFSAEFKRDERDGQFKLLEVNCRHWWYVGFAAACGVDVSLMSYQDALGLPVASIEDYTVGSRCVYPYYDRYPCWEQLRAGQLSPWAWARSWVGAVQPIFCWDDPLPAVANLRTLLRRYVHTKLST